MEAALRPYYQSKFYEDPDAAEISRTRVRGMLKAGMTVDEVAKLELSFLFSSTTNTIPTLYWFMTNTWSRPKLVESLREEQLPVVEVLHNSNGSGRMEGVVDIRQLEGKCPLLVSCYRKTMRLSSQGIETRRLLQDTTIADSNGNWYLLKTGTTS